MYFQNLDMVLAEPLRVSPLIKVRLFLDDNFVIYFVLDRQMGCTDSWYLVGWQEVCCQ